MGEISGNHRDVILNVASKYVRSPALSPNKEIFEFMNCTTLEEAEAKVSSTLKSHCVRVKLLLILTK